MSPEVSPRRAIMAATAVGIAAASSPCVDSSVPSLRLSRKDPHLRPSPKPKIERLAAPTVSNRCSRPVTLAGPAGVTYSTAPIITPGMQPDADSHCDTLDHPFRHLLHGGQSLLVGAESFDGPINATVATPPGGCAGSRPFLLAGHSPNALNWLLHNAELIRIRIERVRAKRLRPTGKLSLRSRSG